MQERVYKSVRDLAWLKQRLVKVWTDMSLSSSPLLFCGPFLLLHLSCCVLFFSIILWWTRMNKNRRDGHFCIAAMQCRQWRPLIVLRRLHGVSLAGCAERESLKVEWKSVSGDTNHRYLASGATRHAGRRGDTHGEEV